LADAFLVGSLTPRSAATAAAKAALTLALFAARVISLTISLVPLFSWGYCL
jgi:hypothetical protein